jgi:hypothetical protein
MSFQSENEHNKASIGFPADGCRPFEAALAQKAGPRGF